MEEYVKLACEYLDVASKDVVRAHIKGNELVVVLKREVRSIPLAELDAAEDDVPEIELDATDTALRLIEQHQVDGADILDFIGEQRRITARDVRDYVKAVAR